MQVFGHVANAQEQVKENEEQKKFRGQNLVKSGVLGRSWQTEGMPFMTSSSAVYEQGVQLEVGVWKGACVTAEGKILIMTCQ